MILGKSKHESPKTDELLEAGKELLVLFSRQIVKFLDLCLFEDLHLENLGLKSPWFKSLFFEPFIEDLKAEKISIFTTSRLKSNWKGILLLRHFSGARFTSKAPLFSVWSAPCPEKKITENGAMQALQSNSNGPLLINWASLCVQMSSAESRFFLHDLWAWISRI